MTRSETSCAQRSPLQLASNSGPDWMLAVPLAVLGVGNLILPENVQEIGGISYIAIFASIVGLYVAGHIIRCVRNFHAVSLVVFGASVAVGVNNAFGNFYSTQKVVGLGLALALMAVPAAFTRRDDGWAKVRGILAPCILGTVVYFFIGSALSSSGRLSLFDMNPIGISRFFGILAVIGCVRFFVRPSGPRYGLWLAGACVIASLTAMIGTGSRGPLVGVIGAVAFLGLSRRSRRLRPLFGLTALMLGGILVSMSVDSNGLARVMFGSDSGRLELYQDVVAVAMENPFGIGWGNLASYLPGWWTENGVTLYAHNILLEFWVEGGIVAPIGLMIVLGVAFRNIVADIRSQESQSAMEIGALLMFCLVNSMFSSDLVGARFLWLVVGFALIRTRRSFAGAELYEVERSI